MRKGMDGLAILVQDTLKKDPFSGHLFAFRGKKASILKVLFWDGIGLCLLTKRIDQGGFVWPVMTGYDGSITLTAQLARASTGARQSVSGSQRLQADLQNPVLN
ncbi:IS66 family insertion sequence element accessory protein TnpB [Bradyrhizobium sp. SZCCHNS3002]|uniref:IS66 family insertion sequence element accessory protein TnpB n=1 Tax=Bradyrhizobium sp. SZCCHNS3002 TaxID=3057310 RepID=UPI0039657057